MSKKAATIARSLFALLQKFCKDKEDRYRKEDSEELENRLVPFNVCFSLTLLYDRLNY